MQETNAHISMKNFITKTMLACMAAAALQAPKASAQSANDSTFLNVTLESYTPRFEKVLPEFEKMLENSAIRMEEKTKDYYVIQCTLAMAKEKYLDLGRWLAEQGCQTIIQKETTVYIQKEKAAQKQRIEELAAKIDERTRILGTSISDQRREDLLSRNISDQSEIRAAENEMKEQESQIGTAIVSVTLRRELTTPSNSRRVKFVNMPGFEYSTFWAEHPEDGYAASTYRGYNLKYVFTQGKSHVTVGVYKAADVPQADTLTYTDIFNLGYGQDFYSRHLGRGTRKFLNLYSGYNIGFQACNASSRSLKNFYVSPTVGLEIYKNSFMLLDAKVAYMLPFAKNYSLRGFQAAVSLNFVF